MKKVLLIIFSFIFMLAFASPSPLKGGVSEEYIPKGFFGSWGVISKLQNSNNPSFFNFQSKDIWTLSGRGDVLILQNLESGAISEIQIKEKVLDGKTLKFQRQKISKKGEFKIIYKETVQFKLSGNNFSGSDDFVVEKYDKNNSLIEKNSANYRVEGVKISGTTSK